MPKKANVSMPGATPRPGTGIDAAYQDVKRTYGKADKSRRWLLTVLRTPRLGILTTAPGGWDMLDLTDDQPPTAIDAYDHNDRNWWCPFNLDRHLLALRENVDHLTGSGAAEPPGSVTPRAIGTGTMIGSALTSIPAKRPSLIPRGKNFCGRIRPSA